MKLRVLIVEDDAMSRELLGDWLDGEGYEFLSAASLPEARRLCEAAEPHAVLLDVQLGGEDGLELAAWLRQHPRLHEIPVIAVTAHAMLTEQARILKSGCNTCVSKPVDFAQLREQLRRWLAWQEEAG